MKQILTLMTIVIFTIQTYAQNSETKSKPISIWSADFGYLISTNAKNNNEGKPLFAGNGFNAGVNYRYGDRWGIAGKIGFAYGKTNTANAQEFANTFAIAPFTARVSELKTNWSQVNFAIGPSVMIGKNKYRGEIRLLGGVSTGAENKIKVDLFDVNTFYKTAYEGTEKKIKPYWEVRGGYALTKINKRIVLNVVGGYGSNGGFAGIVLSDMWRCCFECCKFCPCPPPPKGNK